MRSTASILCASLLLSLPALAQNYSDVLVTEADYQAWDTLRYQESLYKARSERDRANRAKYKATYEEAVAASGMDEERRMQIENALTEIEQLMMEEETGAISKTDLDGTLRAFKPQTVAVARKHLTALREADHMDRAREQARAEAVEARKGDEVKVADLQGVWVVDVDATLRSIMGGMADMPGMEAARADLEKSLAGTSYEFKGDQVIATSLTDGKKNVSKGSFRVEGHQLFINGSTSHQTSLDVGMKDGRLVLGKGFAAAHYKKK